MSNKVPENEGKEIKELVYQEADRINYLGKSRNENGRFLDRLVSLPEVGGRLSGYMKKDDIRTYIKDGILNRYSKDKTQGERPSDLLLVIKKKLSIDVYFCEREPKNEIDLFKLCEGHHFVVVANGTVLKWETALRKALLYVSCKPFFEQDHDKISIILTLFARYQKVTASDIVYLEKALSICGAFPYVYGES